MSKIETSEIRDLQELLQDALEVEHATIPPYFTAWISMMDGFNYEAKETVKTVFIEEMLHLTLVANLMNAINVKPNLIHDKFVPRYPHKLPHSSDTFKIHIEKFSEDALKTFLHIEQPEEKEEPPKGKGFKTIGQFYKYISQRIDYLCDTYGEETLFCGDIAKQIRPEDYYGSGEVIVVKNRNTAQAAITIISEQGEGAHGGLFDADKNILNSGEGFELAHYYRFKQILLKRHYTEHDTPETGPRGKTFDIDYSKIFPLKKDTHKNDFAEGSELRKKLNEFSDSYSALLHDLHHAFNNDRSKLTQGIARMFSLKNQAQAIIQIPIGDGKQTLGLDFTPN